MVFELNLTGEQPWRATLQPGLYRLVLPEHNLQQPAIVEAVLNGRPSALLLVAAGPGSHITVPQNGGLISNLRLWENIVLPRWYHGAPTGDEQEALLLDWVRRMLPNVEDAVLFLHQTIGRLQAEERVLGGLLRAMLSPAPFVWIEADWRNSLSSVQVQLCLAVLDEVLVAQRRLAFVYASDLQALHAMVAWKPAAAEIEWNCL